MCTLFTEIFLGVGKIDNLIGFSGLTTLKLDNNKIAKIEGLEQLPCLVSLGFNHYFYFLSTNIDLSFNKISKIEGLDKLTSLQDLALCSNMISKVENMDTLERLQALSLKNNRIDSIQNVFFLFVSFLSLTTM